MKVNFEKVLNAKSEEGKNLLLDKQKRMTVALAAFSFLGLLWICVFSDTFSQAAKVQAKDYAAEEVLNLELAKQNKNGVSFDKLVDESATQYVNDAEEEELEEVEEETEEEEILPEEPVEEPTGEEF